MSRASGTWWTRGSIALVWLAGGSLSIGCVGPAKAPVLGGGGLASLAAPHDGLRHREIGESVLLQPGQSLTLIDTKASGRIEHLWMTIDGLPGNEEYSLRTSKLSMWWDGDAAPAVRVPVGDFFALGHGMAANVVSEPVVAVWRGLSEYWPMPFAKGARIEVVNEGDIVRNYFFQLDWVELPAKEVEPLRFQASWRRNDRPQPKGMVTVAEITGRGHYVGTVLALAPQERSWWGEGDDVYVADGVTLQGTGTEDFVNMAWGGQALTAPYAGMVNNRGRLLTLYRWFVQDPIPFQHSLTVRQEQLGFAWQGDRADDVAATAFWYQWPPLSAVPELPPPADRLPPSGLLNETWKVPGGFAPVDLVAAARKAGLKEADTTPPKALETPMLAAGARKYAGVEMRLAGAGRAPGVALRDEQAFTFDVPPGQGALYLFLGSDAVRGTKVLDVVAGGTTTPLVVGTQLDQWTDPWSVPQGRGITVGDGGLGIQAAYVTPIALPPDATTVTLRAAGPAVTLLGASLGAMPKAD
jgi:hypothetical protein